MLYTIQSLHRIQYTEYIVYTIHYISTLYSMQLNTVEKFTDIKKQVELVVAYIAFALNNEGLVSHIV